MSTAPYYTDPTTQGVIYGPDGMPAIVVQKDQGKWTAERQALFEKVLAAVNAGEVTLPR